jgi:sulfur carrier protein ThiS
MVFVTSYTNGGRTVESNLTTVSAILADLDLTARGVSYRVYASNGEERKGLRSTTGLNENDEVDIQRSSTKNG